MSFRSVVTASLFGLAACASAHAASFKTFDGRWDVILVTDVGQCEPQIGAIMHVQSDDIIADTASPMRADGSVEANGTMWVRFSAGQDQYRAQGKLTAGGGSGVWSSGSRYCGGKWRATRSK